MGGAAVLTLIKASYTTDEIGRQVPLEERREVFCEVGSVSLEERLEAGKAGLDPQWRATMFRYDYQGERVAELDGKRYAVYRTYLARHETIELYLEERTGV